MRACINSGRDGLYGGKGTRFLGRGYLVSVAYLIFTVNASINTISSGHISQGKHEEAELPFLTFY